MKTYAGIGSRKLNSAQLNFCYHVGQWLAQQGWTLFTGAAPGADQAFANGALSVGGNVNLFLPWDTYENEWISAYVMNHENVCVQVLEKDDHDHFASVNMFHPAPEKLSSSARKLHARNHMIVNGVKFVLAFPGESLGGTGQGIRIAEGNGIRVIRLDLPEERFLVESKIGYKLGS